MRFQFYGMVGSVAVAAALWTVMFVPGLSGGLNFWAMMSVSAVALTALASVFNRGWWQGIGFSFANIALGIAIAAVLWGVFWVGDKVSQELFSFARSEVDGVYSLKGDTNPWVLSALLLFLIGPAEEIFWRRFVQDVFARKAGAVAGMHIALAVYTLIHVGSANLMLVLAAGVCGAAWGGLYYLMPNRFAAILISHALWDAAVFVWFPIE